MASFYPLAEAARRVGGSAVDVHDLTPPGVEPHDLELSPKEIEAIATADVVLYLGGGFQPAVEDAIGEAEGVPVDLLRGMPVEAGDPHVWLDPRLMADLVRRVQTALTRAAPADAARFASNAAAYQRQLVDAGPVATELACPRAGATW